MQPQNKPPLVFITGASSGLGAALARHYARQGATLGLCGRRLDALKQLAQGLNAHCYVADVRDAKAMQTAAQAFIRDAGVPDIVIACAGISVGVLTEEAEDLPVFQAVMDANVMGLLHTFHPFLPAMQARAKPSSGAGGVLCGIASVAGVRGLPGGSAYSASKAAAAVYLEALRVEQKPRGIAVVTVSPGYIDTPMTAVNPYPMPFRMSADAAAEAVARAIHRRRGHVVIPWQMALVARLLRLLPDALYDRLFTNAPHKPRGLKT